MLDELSELQNESDEQHWLTSMSFSIETRDEEDNELIHRTYTFTYAKEWDTWNFSEYEEKRTPDTRRIGDRNWRTSRHVWWNENDPIDVDIPQSVSDKLAECLDCDTVNIGF